MTRQGSRNSKKGFILLLTLIFMTVLTIFTGSLIYMTIADMKNAAPQSDDVNLGALADAGIDRAHRAIRDDYLTTTATGVADLRGADTDNSVSVSNEERMRYLEDGNAVINDNSDQAILTIFDSNYTNTRIISVEIHARADRNSGGTGATMQVAYTTDGTNYTTVITQALTTAMTDYSATVAALTSWSTIMSSNFRLRAMRTAGNRSINLDFMYLRITYSIDTLDEPWADGSYATFPITLGNGTIQSVTITDEERKIHLNYAPQALLSNLLTNLGIASASTKATNIVNYRGAGLANPFDTVEELQQVTGITAADYTAIKDYVTAYSFVNSDVYRPAGPRAPVNINTASNAVLKSIFDSSGLGSGDAQSLADDIIAQRDISPFKGFYLSTAPAGDNTYFYNFIINRGYLSTSGDPDENDRALDTADASSLIPVSGSNSYLCPTTELCYAGGTFHISVLARIGTRNLRVKTIRGNDGSHVFATYSGDPALSGWRKENYE